MALLRIVKHPIATKALLQKAFISAAIIAIHISTVASKCERWRAFAFSILTITSSVTVTSRTHPGTKALGGLCRTQPNVMKPIPTRKLPKENIFSKRLKKEVMIVAFTIAALQHTAKLQHLYDIVREPALHVISFCPRICHNVVRTIHWNNFCQIVRTTGPACRGGIVIYLAQRVDASIRHTIRLYISLPMSERASSAEACLHRASESTWRLPASRGLVDCISGR